MDDKLSKNLKGQRIQSICLMVLAAVALGCALYWLKPVLVPFILAACFSYCLTPVIDVQVRRWRMPKVLAIITTAILALVILAGSGLVVAAGVQKIAQNAGPYQDNLQKLVNKIASRLPLEKFGIDPQAEGNGQSSLAGMVSEGMLPTALSATVSGIRGIVSDGGLVLIFTMFLLAGRGATAAPSGLLGEIERGVKRYLISMILFSAVTGLLVGSVLWILGVDFAWIFGFMAFLLNFIPSIGGILSTLLPLPVILLSSDAGVVQIVLALAIPGAIQFLIGNVVQPKVQGGDLDLHPITVLMALIFFGMIWGVVGMFLATPLTAVAKIVLSRIEDTRVVSELMAGRLDSLKK